MAEQKAPRAQLPWDQSLPAFTPLPQCPHLQSCQALPSPLSSLSWTGKGT